MVARAGGCIYLRPGEEGVEPLVASDVAWCFRLGRGTVVEGKQRAGVCTPRAFGVEG